MKTINTIACVISFATLFISCSNENDATPVNEEELITTITAVFTPEGGGSAVTLNSRDLDGDGPNAPVITISGPFAQNTTYNGIVTFTNESVSPAEDITAEIVAEAEDHQIFYQTTGSLPDFIYSTTAENVDANGKPIGLETVFTTTTAATGVLKISLIHLPNKTAVGVAAGDPTNAGGNTDATEEFTVQVE
ncbi:MAG: type 1 periplasmic binding fold superfamily protein [Flavobacterium sp.]|nr:type 1 periplasmic binding fold superfamily protein [Flavobacterium sp.]